MCKWYRRFRNLDILDEIARQIRFLRRDLIVTHTTREIRAVEYARKIEELLDADSR